jgi:hypothetical protein
MRPSIHDPEVAYTFLFNSAIIAPTKHIAARIQLTAFSPSCRTDKIKPVQGATHRPGRALKKPRAQSECHAHQHRPRNQHDGDHPADGDRANPGIAEKNQHERQDQAE